MSFLVLLLAGGLAGSVGLRVLEQSAGGTPLGLSKAERFAYGACLGMAAVGIVVLVLGSVSLRVAFYAIASAVTVAILFRLWRLHARSYDGEPYAVKRLDLTRLEVYSLSAIIVASLLAFFSALAPNTSWDAAVAHLALASDYVRQGHIGLLEGNVYSAYPHLIHTLYTFVYWDDNEIAVGLLSWLFGPLVCASLFALAVRVDGRRCGYVAAALLATAPIYFSQVGTAGIDIPFSAFALAGLACVFAGVKQSDLRWLVLAGIFIGSACGIRHTGYLIGLLCFVGMLILLKDSRMKAATVFCVAGVAAAAPWLLRSAILTGNPVYPFFSDVFPTGSLPDVQKPSLVGHETAQSWSFPGLVWFPVDVVLRPERYDGWASSPGPIVLLLGIPGLFVGGARARMLGAFSGMGVVCFYFFQRFARYLLPFFAPMMVVAGMAESRFRSLRRPIAALLVFSFVYGISLGAAAVHFKIAVAFGYESPDAYMTRRVERYEAFQWVNRNLPDDAIVMTFDPRSYYIDRPTFQNFEVLRTLRELSLDDQVAWLRARSIRYIFYPEAYIKESPGYALGGYDADIDLWRNSPEYFRLIHFFELPRGGDAQPERVEIYEVRGSSEAPGAEQ